MKILEKRDKKFKTFCDSDSEMFEQLDLTEEEIKKWNSKFYTLEESWDMMQEHMNKMEKKFNSRKKELCIK